MISSSSGGGRVISVAVLTPLAAISAEAEFPATVPGLIVTAWRASRRPVSLVSTA